MQHNVPLSSESHQHNLMWSRLMIFFKIRRKYTKEDNRFSPLYRNPHRWYLSNIVVKKFLKDWRSGRDWSSDPGSSDGSSVSLMVEGSPSSNLGLAHSIFPLLRVNILYLFFKTILRPELSSAKSGYIDNTIYSTSNQKHMYTKLTYFLIRAPGTGNRQQATQLIGFCLCNILVSETRLYPSQKANSAYTWFYTRYFIIRNN